MNTKQQIEKAKALLTKHRGRKPKAPKELSELRKLQNEEASYAFMRLRATAKDRELKRKRPELHISLNEWLYEVVHGKPKAALEGKLELPIRVTFELAPERGQKKITELKEGEIVTRIGDKTPIIASTEEAD